MTTESDLTEEFQHKLWKDWFINYEETIKAYGAETSVDVFCLCRRLERGQQHDPREGSEFQDF